MTTTSRQDASPEPDGSRTPTTLAIDVGGTGLKASVLDADGRKIVKRVRTALLR